MEAVQFAPTGQSKQVKFVCSCLVIILLLKLNDVFKESLSNVHVPRAQGTHGKVSAFVICFKVAFVQPINNEEKMYLIVKVLTTPFSASGTSLVEYCSISVSNSELTDISY